MNLATFITRKKQNFIQLESNSNFYLNKIIFLLMIDVTKYETFRNFNISNKVLLFLIKLNINYVLSKKYINDEGNKKKLFFVIIIMCIKKTNDSLMRNSIPKVPD